MTHIQAVDLPNGTYLYDRVYPYGPNTRIKTLLCDGDVVLLIEGYYDGAPLVSLERLAEIRDTVLTEICDRVITDGWFEFVPFDLHAFLRPSIGGAA